MQKIILASGSIQRKNLFSILNIPFEIIPADIDEKIISDDNLGKKAEKIARAKAEKVALKNEGIVIAADTFIVLDNKVLEKPKNLEEAKKMLGLQSNQKLLVYTGFCYLDKENKINFSATTITNLKFRELSAEEIENYVKKYPVTDWSGSFSPAYLSGTTFIDNINGSLTGCTHGLPLELLIPLLKKSGYGINV